MRELYRYKIRKLSASWIKDTTIQHLLWISMGTLKSILSDDKYTPSERTQRRVKIALDNFLADLSGKWD